MKISKFKGNFYLLILLERVRLLLNEKLKTISYLITKIEKTAEENYMEMANSLTKGINSNKNYSNDQKFVEMYIRTPNKNKNELINSIDSSVNRTSNNNLTSSISSIS